MQGSMLEREIWCKLSQASRKAAHQAFIFAGPGNSGNWLRSSGGTDV